MRSLCPCLFLALLCLTLASAAAQPQARSGIDETRLSTLSGTVHPLAQQKYDRGEVDASFPTGRLLLTLARSEDREQTLQQFLKDAHNPAAPAFHQWLTPAQFGDRFGARDEDRVAVTAWLESHGLSVDRIASNRSTIEFSGTAAQLKAALHTEIHRYVFDGKSFYANSQEISIPSAIRTRIANFAPLNSFPLTSYAAPVGPASYSRATHLATRVASPDFSLTENNAPFYALGPEDFSTQYDVAPIYTAGITGAGETIGIVGTSNINLALIDKYRTLFRLPASHTQVVVDGTDPGDPSTPNIEAFLDTEVSGSVAPAATVNLYVAGGQPLTNSLELAAMRAVEDNQASVLSVSYGGCEQEIGLAGNQFWNSLWEQAAAQGQTVFVSSGDTGPTTCTLIESTTAGVSVVSTLSVNGISSTPWNVSVGGTDFYYSDYATGGASISTLWNATNDSSNGSLKAPLPEQPWDNALGFNITPFNYDSFSVPTVAGGGGVSNCSDETVPPTTGTTTTPTCISGYSKPSWQNAPGVPADSSRDLPDVSLFAANGPNLTAWPICAEPGDCVASSSGNTPIFLVGGTSASSPAMAGIMALIDQKYGRQGQANYTLYALARTGPSVFHDLTLGTNDVLCEFQSGSLCATPIPGQQNPFVESFGVYPAASGYDLASGLGSIDAGKLFTAWNTIAFTPSATTLQVSPATFVHGATAAVTVAVTASTGSATPTGNVAVTTTNAAAALRDNAPLTLANGTASANLSTLPGGTYNLVAQYSGDATFAASASSPVALTITPEASTTTILPFERLAVVPSTSNFPSLSNEPYGSAFSFQAIPEGGSGGTTSATVPVSSIATGTVTFIDASTSTTIPININGTATWSPQVLALGTHSITAAYSGDASYIASTSSPLAITIVKGTPLFEAVPEASEVFLTNNQTGGSFVYPAGENLVVHVLLRGSSFSVPPSGTVTVNLGSMTQTVTLNPNEYLNENLANAFVTLPAVPAGTYILTASYSGDANWNAGTYTYGQTLGSLTSSAESLVFAPTGASPTTTVLTLTPATVDSSGSVAVTATVTDTDTDTASSSTTFTGTVLGTVVLFGNGTAITSMRVAAPATSGTPLVFTGTATIPATAFPVGTLQIVGVYLGDGNDMSSTSAAVPLTVTASDFSLSIAASALAIKAGSSATVPVLLGSPYTVGVPVTLSCASPSTAITCTITPGSSTVTGTATATLTLNAFILTAAADFLPSGRGSHFDLRKTAAVLALVVVLVLPNRRRSIIIKLTGTLLLFLVASSIATGCSSGGATTTPPVGPTPPPTQTNAPAGQYTVTVKAISGGIEHTTAITVQIE